MNVKKAMEQLAQETGMRFDPEIKMVHGRMSGHNMCITLVEGTFLMNVAVSVEKNGSAPANDEFKQYVSGCKVLNRYQSNGRRVDFVGSGAASAKNWVIKGKEAIDAITTCLTQYGYVDCCEGCGTETGVGAYYIDGEGHNMCADCFNGFIVSMENKKSAHKNKKGNLVTGLVGALLGSLLGILAIVVVGRLGYVAAISGVIMGVCTLKGYELLGGKANVLGISLCSLLMIFMVLVGNNIDWAFEIIAYFDDVTFFEAYQAIPMLISEEVIEMSSYGYNLAMLYIFTVLGAFPTIKSFAHTSSGSYKAKQAA